MSAVFSPQVCGNLLQQAQETNKGSIDQMANLDVYREGKSLNLGIKGLS